MNQAVKSDTPNDESNEYYAKHKKIYPRKVTGLFARLRVLGVLALLGLYYLIPWVQYDGHQAVLFDLPARKFYIFGLVFWPQDFIYLALLLIVAALALFFFTTLAGRLWCGYACPQTVWTEVFLWIEEWIEGDRNRRIKLDKSPWTAHKIRIKATKHLLWFLFAAWTGFTFVGYFTPITTLWQELTTFSLGPWETFWILFYSFATWGNAGFLREQVCIYMCPYARFQSSMFDRDTLIISYDEKRGEPRGTRRKGVNPREVGLGDCVDCTLCVQVCPTGIDIRNGLQYQCIGCAACIDVCDQVMDKMNYPEGLIRYTTENAMEGKPTRILRPRIVIYGLLLAFLTGLLFYSMATRTPLRMDIIRDRNVLYQETTEGLVENTYILKIINMDEKPHAYHLSVDGIKGLQLVMRQPKITAPSGKVITIPVQVQVDPVNLKKPSNDIHFHLQAVDDPELSITETGRFLGPVIH